MNPDFFRNLLAHSSKLAAEYLPRVIGALLLLWLGLYAVRRIVKVIRTVSGKPDLDPTLRNFFIDLANFGLKAMLFVSVASMLGFETTSFVAIFGAASFAVGLALQGSLANFAGGVLILMFRPFRVGDLIESGGNKGFVTAINIFVTTLRTLDNRVIIMPNGPLSNGVVVNFSAMGAIRVEVLLRLDYETSIAPVRALALQIMQSHPLVMQSPEPDVVVAELGEHNMSVIARPFCRPEDAPAVETSVREALKAALDKAGIDFQPPMKILQVK